MARQEAEQQLRDALLLFQQHVQQTLDPTQSPHLSASQRNHIRHVAQHLFHHLAGPVRKTWLNALDNHLSSLPTSSSTTTATSSSHSAPVLLPDMAAAQSELAEQHSLLTSTLQHAIDTVRANNLELVPDGTNDTPATTAATPTKRRKTAQPQQSTPRSEAPVEVEEASRVVVARAEVDNMLDQVNELLKKERLEWRELHTFLAAHPQQHSGADVEAAGGVEAGGVVGRGGSEVGNAIGGVAGGVNAGSGSAGSSQLSSPSSGHSKQVAAGLAKRLNRSSAM